MKSKSYSMHFLYRPLTMFLYGGAFVFFLSGCATQQVSETNSVSLTKLETQEYQPITRLAFVESDNSSGHIAVVRTNSKVWQVSDIETAAGNPQEKVIEQ